MIEERHEHWAEDEEQRERFILGFDEAALRSVREAHLALCASCRELVQGERMLAKGVQQEGRKRLRRELQTRLAVQNEGRSVGAWRWIAVAAVLVAAVGIWRLMTPPERAPIMTDSPPKVEREPSPSPEPETERPTESPSPLGRREYLTDAGTSSAAGASERYVSAPRPRAPEPAAAGEGLATDLMMAEAEKDQIGAEESWTIGMILPQEESRMEADQEYSKAAKALPRQGAKREEAQQRGPMSSAQYIQLQQNTLKYLPSTRQQLAAREVSGAMPVRLMRRGDSLFVELYLSSPYADDAVRLARLKLPATDSLVIEIEHKRIAIRLPAGYTPRQVPP